MKKLHASSPRGAIRDLLRSLTIPIAVAILLVAAGFVFTTGLDAPRPRRARAAQSPIEVARVLPREATPVGVVTDRVRYLWTPGTLLRYEFGFRQSISTTMGGALLSELAKQGASPQGQQAEGKVEILADLTVRVYDANDGEAIVGYRLESPSIDYACAGESLPPQAIEEMETSLSQEVLARLTDRGEVQDLRFAAESCAKTRNMMRSILALVRIVLPEWAERSWTTREEDALGTFEGMYSGSPVGGEEAMRVRKVHRYLEVKGDASEAAPSPVDASIEGGVDATIATRAGVLAEVVGRLSSELRGKDLAYDCRTTLEVSMKLASVERGGARTAGVRRFGDLPSSALGYEPETEAERRARTEADGRLAETTSIDQLLDALDSVCRAGDFTTRGTAVGLELVALLRADDGEVAKALARMRDPRGHEGAVYSTIVFALGRAATPAAQEALLAIVRGEGVSAEIRHYGVLASVQIDAPSPALLDGLERQLDAGQGSSDSTTLALLEGLGIAASRRADRGDREGAEATAARLERELASSSDPRRLRAALIGIGNAAQRRSVAAIEARLRDADERVRAAAVGALERMPADLARPLLERVGREDSSDVVRTEAAAALARK